MLIVARSRSVRELGRAADHAGDVGGVHTDRAVFISGRSYLARFRRKAGKRDCFRHHRRVGYLGGVLAGDTVARISISFGWQGMFMALAGVGLVSSLSATFFLIEQRRSVKTKFELEST